MVMMEGNMPTELQNTLKNYETQSNPWGISPDARDEWCKDLNISRMADKPNAEYLFYVGCAGSFNDRNKKISTATVKILQKAGIDFAILGKEELCNGETARRAGNEYLAKAMVDANIEVLKRYNVKKIITTCPHCFNTLKNEYPDFGFTASEVLHHTDFIQRLISEGKITPQGKDNEHVKIAFHDSCYLGRYNEVYEAPRQALKAVPGVELVEMPRNKSQGLCCGAGGARMWMEENIGKRINVERVEEALDQKPDVIAAGCPFCQVMISDGVTEKGQQEKVQVKDLAEIIADTLS
jgi:Fe-S oxidoreductase